ncbi:MAG: hypothetical protein ABW022_03075 [Actinoplanes sp.]
MTARHVRKADIIAILRSRGKAARADWFEREIPDIVNTAENSSLLGNLEIDVDTLESADRVPQSL